MITGRAKILDALVAKLKEINNTGDYTVNLFGNVQKSNKFWDEVTDFPYVCVIAGTETRDYLPSDFTWGLLSVSLRVYVKGETPVDQLEEVIGNVEQCINRNRQLVYDTNKETTEIEI